MIPRKVQWMILIIPSLVLGIWEYVRHAFLLPYVSMELGNWLAPLIVFGASVIFLKPLFHYLDRIRDELQKEREERAILLERERIARELHDGVAQSLFLLTVQADRLERDDPDARQKGQLEPLRKTIHHVNAYVRQAIADLRTPIEPNKAPWQHTVEETVRLFREETGIETRLDWRISETLDVREKLELHACLREALMNIRKHANASHVWICAVSSDTSWKCTIEDDGAGFATDALTKPNAYGLAMMRERCARLGWGFEMVRTDERTSLQIRKGEWT
jgi:signal transduction histidine kinase